jgi:hypothetical protein
VKVGAVGIWMFVPKLDCWGANLFFVRVNRFWCVWIRVLDFLDA